MDISEINTSNSERILTYIDALTITKKEYNYFKQLSIIEKERIEKKLKMSFEEHPVDKKYLEEIILGTEYKNISSMNKEIMLANAILPDDQKIATLLNEEGFTLEYLKIIIRFRSLLKNILTNNLPIDKETRQKLDAYKVIVEKLVDLFNKHFNVNNQTIILNRICEMLVTCPELFVPKSKTKKIR